MNKLNNKIKLITETYKIRGEQITIESKARIDTKTGKQIFDKELDDQAINTAFDVYRQKHNIIDSNRIKALRKIYGLSQRDFAELLGWSPTTLATYETGALPNNANNKLLLVLEDTPLTIDKFYQNSKNMISKNGQQYIEEFINNEKKNFDNELPLKYINSYFESTNYTENAGYKEFDLNKVANIVLFFIDKLSDISKTKMNKLLFYSDFKNFKENINSITGLSYAKLPYGPVPNNYKEIYPILETLGFIKIEDQINENSFEYERFKANTTFDKNLFDEDELKTLEYVLNQIGKKNATQLSNMSHQEEGWQKVDKSNNISYSYAQNLSI